MTLNPNHIRIASPCSMDWHRMSGNERTRFCSSCSLNVYNISEMTTDEVSNLLESGGRICARIYRRTDGTILTRDCPAGLRARRKRLSRVAAGVFSALLGLCSVAFGQTSRSSDGIIKDPEIVRTVDSTKSSSIKGVFKDQEGAFIPGVGVVLRRADGKTELKTKTSDTGEFQFASLAAGSFSFELSAPGFSLGSIEQKITVGENEQISLTFRLEAAYQVGVVAAPGADENPEPGPGTLTTTITPRKIAKSEF